MGRQAASGTGCLSGKSTLRIMTIMGDLSEVKIECQTRLDKIADRLKVLPLF